MKHEYVIKDGILYINGNAISLSFPVIEAVEIENLIVVRTKVPPKERFNRNIYALDLRGNLVWQIQECPHGGNTDKPFMNLMLSEDMGLIVGNWVGIDYKVNLKNGTLNPIKFTK